MNALEAREYIKNFKHTLGRQPDHVTFGNGDTIWFNKMTDEQAIRVAKGLLDIEMDATNGVRQ